MEISFQSLLVIWTFLLVPLQNQDHFALAESTCGSLITYRQYSTLLAETAPQCLINGCTTTSRSLSMSDSCPEPEPCSELWDLVHTQYQQDWCSDCPDDIACRIPGWPILNATALCDIEPNTTWIFGATGSCCTSGNDSFELAAWVGSMCNDSQWRKPFDYYGGMAQLDWHEWLLPWNWTVMAQNSSTANVTSPQCHNNSQAFAAFAGENILYLLVAIAVSLAKIFYILKRERSPAVRRFHERCHVFTLWKFWRWGKEWKRWREGRNPEDIDEKGRTQIFVSVLWSIFMTSFQIGMNFATAYLIKRSPGFQDVPIAKLAILFCCRPRLTWLACGLEFIRMETIKRRFNFETDQYATKAQLALGTIGIGSAISEFMLQIISAYYMGLTANVGRIRGFYLLHHLLPYWKGHSAQNMYLGALVWLIGCLFIIIVWPLVFYYGIRTLNRVQKGYNRLKNWGAKQKSPDGKYHATDIIKNIFTTKPPPEQRQEGIPVQNQEIVKTEGDTHGHGAAGEIKGPVNAEGGFELVPPPPNPDSGDRNEIVEHTHEETPQGDRNMMIPLSTDPANSSRSPTTTTSPIPLTSGALSSSSATVLGGSTMSSTLVDQAQSSAHIISPGPKLQEEPKPESVGGAASEIEEEKRRIAALTPPRVEETREERRDRERKELCIGFGIGIGIVCYAVQWAFWYGFVKTAGPRFCPPPLTSAVGLWITASLSGFAIPAFLQ